MAFDKTDMGSPYRILDQKTRAAQADKTYDVLSTLSQAVGGVMQLQHQDHQKDMQRKAKNDLVNNTINPDLQLHERTYAETVAKGQALNTFHDMKSRINSGEFDNSSPEEFQEQVNNLHAEKAREFSPSTYAKEATGAWNDFWVEQEATLTAGQAGRYRIALHGKEVESLGGNLVTKWKQGTYTAEDMTDEIMSSDYSMLSTEDRRAVALDAGALLAINGDDTLLNIFDQEFDFQNDPKYAKKYDAALKVAHRKQRMIAEDGVMQVRHNYNTKVATGTLTADDWDADVTGGVGEPIPLSKALDMNGNPLVSYKEFSQGLIKAQGNFVNDRKKNRYKEMIQSGVNTYGLASDPLYQEAVNEIATDIMQEETDAPDKASRIGQLASKQTAPVKMIKNMGDTFATTPVLEGNEVSEDVIDSYNFLEAMRQGYNNDPKFLRAIGDDAAARYKIMEHAGRYTVGTTEEKARAGAKAVAIADRKAEQGTIQKVQTLPEGTTDEIASMTNKYLGEQDAWWRWDSRRDEDIATSDFKVAVEQHYRFLRNTKGLTHEPALELAMEQTKEASVLFDGSIVMTWGAELPFNDSPENIVATLKNDPSISAIVAEKYSTGTRMDPREADLFGKAPEIKDPDWDEVRLVPDVASNSIMFMDTKNEVIFRMPVEHAAVLNEAKRQGVHNDVDLDIMFSEESLNTPDGKRRVNEAIESNEKFAQEVLKDPDNLPIIQNIPKPKFEDWTRMNEKERTATRRQYYRENFDAVHSVNQMTKELREGTFPNGARVLMNAGVTEFKKLLKDIKIDADPVIQQGRFPTPRKDADDQETYEERMAGQETVPTDDGSITVEDISPYDDLIDFDFIANNEGGLRTQGYTVKDAAGNIYPQSGVTVGVGVDLAHMSESDLVDAGVNQELIDKVKPALGVKGEAAGKVQDISLTNNEAMKLTNLVQERELGYMQKKFNEDSEMEFKDMPEEWRTVLSSVFWQFGRQATGFKFWGYLVNGDYESALEELRDFGDDFPTRRNAEADYIQGTYGSADIQY